MLLGDGHVVSQGLDGLPVFGLKHHFQLLLSGFCGVIFFGIDVEAPRKWPWCRKPSSPLIVGVM